MGKQRTIRKGPERDYQASGFQTLFLHTITSNTHANNWIRHSSMEITTLRPDIHCYTGL